MIWPSDNLSYISVEMLCVCLHRPHLMSRYMWCVSDYIQSAAVQRCDTYDVWWWWDDAWEWEYGVHICAQRSIPMQMSLQAYDTDLTGLRTCGGCPPKDYVERISALFSQRTEYKIGVYTFLHTNNNGLKGPDKLSHVIVPVALLRVAMFWLLDYAQHKGDIIYIMDRKRRLTQASGICCASCFLRGCEIAITTFRACLFYLGSHISSICALHAIAI